jgi:hypothetical protein
MNNRELIIGGIALTLGFATGIAVSPKGKVAGTPVEDFSVLLNTFRTIDKEQANVWEYRSESSYDVAQSLILDTSKDKMKLLGVEYTISDNVYKELSEDERKSWHSNSYEVNAGLVAGPKLLPFDEETLIRKLRSSWSKTYWLWNPAYKVPVGTVRFWKPFSDDGQVDPSLLARRDSELNVSTIALRRKRNPREQIGVGIEKKK